MKKLIAITMIIMLCISLAACMGDTTPTEETSTHTLPPTEASVAIEPEWAEIDCDIALVDSKENLVVAAEDFETFAVIGNDDSASTYIIIKVSDDATQTVKSMSSQELSLTINGEYVSKVYVDSTFTSEIEIGHDLDYNSLCELATTIRGLF